MPTYEYACKSCGQHLEVVQSFRDGALEACPNCGGQLRKVFGTIGIAFKGNGFYRTDNRPAPKSEITSESKSEAKSESKRKASGSAASAATEAKSA